MPDVEFHPVQVAAWQRLDPDQKWRIALRATTMLRDAARRRIARRHPDWSAEAVNRETARFLIRART
jgi:hypothetical protein